MKAIPKSAAKVRRPEKNDRSQREVEIIDKMAKGMVILEGCKSQPLSYNLEFRASKTGGGRLISLELKQDLEEG